MQYGHAIVWYWLQWHRTFSHDDSMANFFWPTKERVQTLLNFKTYKAKEGRDRVDLGGQKNNTKLQTLFCSFNWTKLNVKEPCSWQSFPNDDIKKLSHSPNPHKVSTGVGGRKATGSISASGVGEGTFKALHVRRQRYSAIQIKYKLKGRKQVAKWTSNWPFTSVAFLWIQLRPELLNSYRSDGGYKGPGVWSFQLSSWQAERTHKPFGKPGLEKEKGRVFCHINLQLTPSLGHCICLEISQGCRPHEN